VYGDHGAPTRLYFSSWESIGRPDRLPRRNVGGFHERSGPILDTDPTRPRNGLDDHGPGVQPVTIRNFCPTNAVQSRLHLYMDTRSSDDGLRGSLQSAVAEYPDGTPGHQTRDSRFTASVQPAQSTGGPKSGGMSLGLTAFSTGRCQNPHTVPSARLHLTHKTSSFLLFRTRCTLSHCFGAGRTRVTVCGQPARLPVGLILQITVTVPTAALCRGANRTSLWQSRLPQADLLPTRDQTAGNVSALYRTASRHWAAMPCRDHASPISMKCGRSPKTLADGIRQWRTCDLLPSSRRGSSRGNRES